MNSNDNQSTFILYSLRFTRLCFLCSVSQPQCSHRMSDSMVLLHPAAGSDAAPHKPSTAATPAAAPKEHVVYATRWWVLFLFSWGTAMQCTIWVFYGPVSDQAKLLYDGWGDSMINMQAAWGNIVFFPAAIITAIVIERKGLRFAVLLAVGVCVLGAACRCITTHTPWATYLVNIGILLRCLRCDTEPSSHDGICTQGVF
jgi:hypothetical protein